MGRALRMKELSTARLVSRDQRLRERYGSTSQEIKQTRFVWTNPFLYVC
jgi:hypothetical protein